MNVFSQPGENNFPVLCIVFVFPLNISLLYALFSYQFSFGKKYLLIIIQQLKKLYILHIFVMFNYFMEYSIESRRLLHCAYIEQ